ncbi:50S ribosomal protein L32 [Boudabousia tangfeifanii]|uniref:Large ribosomal subunit protein bL32 n=1 Tax=Boudabousia tangfeifanii TaxID=1912795 RepID=A0A1D9MJC6_9ACTO|nr:50S ribosomal protein L32 [Boudabousia tangfeifanii]AOZ72405.1 50S ribosomal protein L32 [Boudabousia tangfeifanii]
MAVPKRKMSRSNTRSRRSQWKAQLTELVNVRVDGREVAIPRRLTKAYKTGLVEVED